MRNFLLGVAVGATAMGLYTGAIRIDLDERVKRDVDKVKDRFDEDDRDDIGDAEVVPGS